MSRLQSQTPLTLLRIIIAGIHHWWRVSLAVAIGVAIATAVIVGALLVGDSMRGSLRALTLERLGRVESAIIPGGFFEVAGITEAEIAPVAVILFHRAVAESRSPDNTIRRAGSIQVLGIDDDFWALGNDEYPATPELSGDNVIVNRATAIELGLSVGDLITLRLPVEQAVPADSPLGRRDTESEGLPRMKVIAIIGDDGLGRFTLAASQASPMNVFVSRQTIAEALGRSGQANLLLADRPLQAQDLKLDLADFGLQLRRVTQEHIVPPDSIASRDDPADARPVFDYYSLTSDRLLIPDAAVSAILGDVGKNEVVELVTYLANAIELTDDDGNPIKSVPYSTITATQSTKALPLDFTTEIEGDDDVVPLVINSWTAKQLDAAVGTRLRVAYYEPEVENGNEIERLIDAIVTDVVPITEPAEPYRRNRAAVFDQTPTVYNDPHLTPIVPGVTDQDSINDWDLPFQLQRKISQADDQYWNNYRLTPKAFLPLEMGKRLFGSRFGATTGLRFGIDTSDDVKSLERRLLELLRPVQADLGWAILPIRQQQLASSRGTTPFDGLFLSLSFFVILAAVLLIAMLFRLGLVTRTRQFGALMAVGWPASRVSRLALGEGLLIAVVGVLGGLALGVSYAYLVLWGLRSWWVGAVTVPFLTFHWTWTSLIAGAAVGWLVAAATLWAAVRWITRASARALVSGADPDVLPGRPDPRRTPPAWVIGVGILGLAIAGYGATQGGQTAAGAFVGGGTLLLIAALLLLHWVLQHRRGLGQSSSGQFSVWSLAWLSAARHPLRSTMTIGLMASAAFLVIAISAFQLRPSNAGTGGFELIGQTAQPMLRDLRDGQVQSEFFGASADQLTDTTIVPIRLRLGQDASCNNLYQATQPTVLGIPDSFSSLLAAEGSLGFETTGGDQEIWELIKREASGTSSDPIPMVIDQNTAMWSLQMMQGVGEVKSFEYQPGKPVSFQVVGMLSNSTLQGKLLIGERNFERLFPGINGYRFFLFSTPSQSIQDVASVLEDRLGDFGMDVSLSDDVLESLMAVQNTYLRTFQSLGGLGLLLGTIGLAVAQLRSVLERRSELGVMQAIGFTRRRLAQMVLGETTALLVLGVGCGSLCASLVVIPHAVLSGLRPPIAEPLVWMILILLFGLIASFVAVRQVLKLPLLNSLRSE